MLPDRKFWFTSRSPLAFLTIVAFCFLCCLASCTHAPPPVEEIEPVPRPRVKMLPPVYPTPPPKPLAQEVDDPRLGRIAAVTKAQIAAGNIPGAVILVGHQGKVVYCKAFGNRYVEPCVQPMTVDTIFDLASVTKVVATTTAIMQLVDGGCLNLDKPVAQYWPEFAQSGKGRITLRQLMTHSSGLRADVNPNVSWSRYQGAIAAIAADRPIKPPGTNYHYSDANFIALGEIVRRVSGKTLDVYCTEKIFRPLGLNDTTFRPPPAWQARIVPSDKHGGKRRWGEVHDPTANRMGGVAGNAGVFSTAGDLAVFAQMLTEGGVSRGQHLLTPAAIAAMTKPHCLPGSSTRRGLGWDLHSPYSYAFNRAFPTGSYGHTGYTGTSIWIDPKSKSFLIILTDRLYPDGRGEVRALRAQVSAAVAAGLPLGPPDIAALDDTNDDLLAMTGHGASDLPDRVRPGIEVLAASGFAPLVGKNIGVITNHSGIDTQRRSMVAILRQAPGVKLKTIFSPEHGLSGNLDEKVASGKDPATGLPVYSLYGEAKKPTAQMLRGLDALVYDIQDIGVRFYTYITTMAYCMEAAAAHGLDFYVLDRPDPINAVSVQGPVLEECLKSFVGYCPMPVRYGMTPGELAQLINTEKRIGARLHVVKMKGYQRHVWFDQTGLPWVNPSPNLRSLTQVILYPGVALVESANVSVGRGTNTPFELVGAPWISGKQLAGYLEQRNIKGVTFEPVAYVPQASPFRGQRCEGVRLRLVDRAAFDSPAFGIELASALYRLYPGSFQIDRNLGMIGSRPVLAAIKNGVDPRDIQHKWQPGLDAFGRVRAKYLLY
jgi:uncharacterized protein YbbC (DUF1343 family)/CubicO group peptidase (beta-lactamase class C family)